MIRLYYDVAAFQALVSEDSILNIETFKVYESPSKDGKYQLIIMVDYNPKQDYIEVPAFVAATTVAAATVGYFSQYDWFKLSYMAGYSMPTLIQAESVPVTALEFAVSLASYPIVPRSVVLKIAGVTLGTTEGIDPQGDRGDGFITGTNIASAYVDYTSGLLMGTLASTPSGDITVNYQHYLEYHKESDLSESVLSEDMYNVVLKLRDVLHDTNFAAPAFSDEELTRKVKEATRRFKGKEGSILIYESELSAIIILVRISCCYDLAYENSRHYRLELPDGVKVFRGEIMEHYVKLAQSLEGQYKQLMEDWGGSKDDNTLTGAPTFEVVQTTKSSYFKSGDRLNLRNGDDE
jgi:hypothetical protein